MSIKKGSLLIALVFAFGLFVPELGETQELQWPFDLNVHDAVLNGARIDSSKSLVASHVVGVQTENGNCTGVIIAKDIVLTAAHCLDSDAVNVVFYTVDKNGYITVEEYYPNRAIKHSSYKETKTLFGLSATNGFDLGLIRLRYSLPNGFSPVSVNSGTAAIDQNSIYFIIGYGLIAGDTESPLDKKNARSDKAGAPHEAQISPKNLSKSSANKKPMISLKGKVNVCRGDSGGPLLRLTEGKLEIVGIASNAKVGCQESQYVDVTGHLQWIANEIKSLRSIEDI